MALKDILSNPKYGDDLIITIGQGADAETVKVGEIRALPVEERKALTASVDERARILAQAEQGLATRFEQAIDAGWLSREGTVNQPPQQVQTITPQPTTAQVRTAAAAEFNLDENDPLLGSVVKLVKTELAQRDQTITDLRAELETGIFFDETADFDGVVHITFCSSGFHGPGRQVRWVSIRLRRLRGTLRGANL